MIKIRDLSKKYGTKENAFYALHNISLEIEKGSLVAIQGKSGAGKSTLLHIMGCLDTFDTGEYLLDGIPIKQLRDTQLAKLRNQKIGFVLQDFSLINHKSVLFNVMLPLYFNRTPYGKMKQMALEALELVGIQDQAKKLATQLSGGQRQRVAIARAIINHPAIVLADEPTGALDTVTSKQIMELFTKLNQKGMSVLVVTHDPAVANYCSRVIVISDGKIVEDQDKDQA